MSESRLSNSLEVFLGLCASFLPFGSVTSWEGAFSLQDFMLMPPCSLNQNSTYCCPTCLGISHIEYSLYVAVPCFFTIVSIIVSGLLVDIFGLPVMAIIFSSLSFIGNVVRALATHFVSHHNILVFLFVFGQTVLQCTLFSLVLCREIIVNRYFPASVRPLVMGIAVGISNSGNLLGGFVMSPLADKFGVPTGFWAFTPLTIPGVVLAIALCFVFWKSSQIKAIEQEIQGQNQERMTCAEAVVNARSFLPQYWVLFGAYLILSSIPRSYTASYPDFQTALWDVSAVQAGINSAWGQLAYAIAAPIGGCVLWATGRQVVVLTTIAAILLFGLTLIFIDPLINIILTMSAHSSIMATAKVFYNFYVPIRSLGLAGSLMISATLANFSVLGLVTGAVEQANPGHKGATIVVVVHCVYVAVAFCLLLFLQCYYGNPGSGDESRCVFQRQGKDTEEENRPVLQDVK